MKDTWCLPNPVMPLMRSTTIGRDDVGGMLLLRDEVKHHAHGVCDVM